MIIQISVTFLWIHKFALENIGIHCLRFCVNIRSNRESISGVATVWKYDKCITFSRDLLVHAMGELGSQRFNPVEFSFEPNGRFSSLSVALIRNLFNWIENQIFCCPKTNIVCIIEMPEYWTIFIYIDMWLNILSFKQRPVSPTYLSPQAIHSMI